MQKFRQWWNLTMRGVRLRLAGWIVRPLGVTTASSDVLFQLVKKIAELESYIEKSGYVRTNSHAYHVLRTRVTEVSKMLEAAVRIGDPGTQAKQLIEVYMQARWLSMSRNQQKKYQMAQAAKAVTNLPRRTP